MQKGSTILLYAGLILLFVGERAGEGITRWITSGLGVAVILTATIMCIGRFAVASGQRKNAAKRLLTNYGVVLLGVAAYVLQTREVGLFENSARDLLQIATAALVTAGLLPASAIEIALRSAGDAPQVEGWRIKLSARSAYVVLFALIAFAGLNYTSSKWNRKIDLSYFKTSQVGTANLNTVRTLSEPLEVVLFFPPGNDVLEQARRYVDGLAQESDKITVRVADQPLMPDLAREYKVRNNGYLGLKYGEHIETLRLGLDVEGAASMLRKLDGEVQAKLIKVLHPPRIAYFTTGHLERDYSPPADDKRRSLSDFKQVLAQLGFTTKRLGLGEGLGSEIPQDATVVIVAGPIEEFLAQEVQALHRYLRERGGRVVFFMDPDHGSTGDALLAPLGVKVSRALVATDDSRYQWRIEGDRPTPYNVTSNNTSSHPSMSTMSKAGGRLATLLQGSGSLSKLDGAAASLKTTFTLRSMGKNYLDLNGNQKFDAATEKRATLNLAAAIAANVEDGKDGAEVQPLRAVVFADADFIGNMIVRNQGNYVVVMDALRWLTGDEDLTGTIESEKDVRIEHRKDKDQIWFYGSSILLPVGVLAFGLIGTRRGRKGGRA